MSGVVNCYDNAAMESFFHSLKTEWTDHNKYKTRDAAQGSIFKYIEVFYNRQSYGELFAFTENRVD